MKKIISLLLAAMMIFSLACVASAEGEKPITINFVVEGETVKTIQVDYDEDYNSQAPVIRTQISNGMKKEFGGWECNNKVYNKIYSSLPVIPDGAPVYELTFIATFTEEPYDGEEIVEDIIGDDAMVGLRTIWDSLLAFLQQILLIFSSFFVA